MKTITPVVPLGHEERWWYWTYKRTGKLYYTHNGGGGQGNAKWNRIYAPNGHNNAPSLFFHNVYNNYNIIAQNTMPIAWNNKSS